MGFTVRRFFQKVDPIGLQDYHKMIVITNVVKELPNFEKADPKRRYYSQLSYCHVEGIPNKKVGEAHGD